MAAILRHICCVQTFPTRVVKRAAETKLVLGVCAAALRSLRRCRATSEQVGKFEYGKLLRGYNRICEWPIRVTRSEAECFAMISGDIRTVGDESVVRRTTPSSIRVQVFSHMSVLAISCYSYLNL